MTVVLSLWRGEIFVKGKTAREIVAEVAASHGLSVTHLEARIRTKRVSEARQEAMWACRQVTRKDGSPRYSYPFIGRLLGGRDHTTVLWGERQHAKRMAAEKVAA